MKNFLNSIKSNSELWPLLTFIVILFGYLGFYNYTNLNGIIFSTPDLSLIIGIGLYNILIASVLFTSAYSFATRKREPLLVYSLFITCILHFNTIHPKLISGFILLWIQLFVYNSLKKIPFSKRRKLVINRNRNNVTGDIIIGLILTTIITLFVDSDFWFKVVIIHFIIMAYHKLAQEWKKSVIGIIIVSLTIPFFTSAYFLNDIRFTLFGLSQQYSKITLRDKKEIEGIITYISPDDIYIKTDSTNIVFPKQEIIKIEKNEPKIVEGKTGLEVIKSQIKELKRIIPNQ
tara:strand:- start:3997 stop:4863 length:867 start_codon:yes stop_codon:yes gene_type:complete